MNQIYKAYLSEQDIFNRLPNWWGFKANCGVFGNAELPSIYEKCNGCKRSEWSLWG